MATPADRLLASLRDTLVKARITDDLPVLVAYSGGLDSTVLLWAAHTLWPGRVKAFHVNHGLQAKAEAWVEHCRLVCQSWNIPLTVSVPTLGTGASVEAQARTARYEVFADALSDGQRLLLAHHRDDQLETMLFRLVRGSGIDGLAGMPARRSLGAGELVRPWLDLPQSELTAAAEYWRLNWVDDPSNRDRQLERNFIRYELMPLLRSRWPSVDDALARSHRHVAVAAQRLNYLDGVQLTQRLQADGSLDIKGLSDPIAGIPVLRLWLHRQGVSLATERQINHLWDDVVCSADDAQGLFRRGPHDVRRHQNRLYVVPRLPPLAINQQSWDPAQDIALSAPAWGVLSCKAVRSGPRLDQGRLNQALTKAPLQVRFRQGGEYMHPVGRQGGRDLKRLLQESGLPPWWRARVPLVYCQDQLIAVADLLVAQDWQAEADAVGYQLCWKKPS
ncbi:MAG: tRNA lysidine(34) synthetase TilS [Natronospirillum sp.]